MNLGGLCPSDLVTPSDRAGRQLSTECMRPPPVLAFARLREGLTGLSPPRQDGSVCVYLLYVEERMHVQQQLCSPSMYSLHHARAAPALRQNHGSAGHKHWQAINLPAESVAWVPIHSISLPVHSYAQLCRALSLALRHACIYVRYLHFTCYTLAVQSCKYVPH